VLESELNPIEQAIYDALLSDPFFTAIEKMTKLRKMCLESEGKYTATCNAIEVSLARSKYQAAKVIPKIVLAETSFAQGITREYEINHDDSEALAGAEPEQALAQRIAEHFVGRLKVFILDGQTSHNREQIQREFREHKAPALLFTLTSVAGEAIDLSCAADAILLSPALTEAQEQQFSRRLNRRGQHVWTDLQILQFSGTIEEGIAEYAARKARVVEDFINGRPLNDEERKILEGNLSAVNRGGSLAYELLSPGEKISWIISRISGKGRAAVEEFFARENGKYANDFAQHYTTNEDTSYAGNTARLVTSVIERLRVTRELAVDGTVKIADIACGCRSLERIYQEDASVRVASSDINRAALEAGGSLIGERFVTEDREVAAMDHLPYGNCVKDVAVLSLALHYSRHNPRISSKSGEERLRILGELARIVRHNGISILTFPAEKFQSEERFTEFNKAICDHFGFTLVEESSGLVQGVGAADESFAERAPYRGWVLTMTRNERVPTPFSEIPKASWVALKFDKPPADTSADDSAGGLMAESNSEHVKMDKGVYIDQFTIGHTRHNYNLLSTAEAARAEQRAADANTETQLDSVLRDLLTKYGKAEAIPEHALLSISLTKVDSATAAERDRYFRTLIEHYGSVHRVPVDKIALFSPVILIRGESRRGPYLCLASTAGRSGQMGDYGKRYLDNAFREQAGTHI